MAEVYLAMVAGPTGSGFAKLAVVKRLRANLADDPDFIAMLVDEARITARLNHPNVVQTLEVGTVGSEYFLAMEYLDGQPLHRLQRRAVRFGEPLKPELEYLVVYDALAGLQHTHELADYDGTPLNVIHRDLTPENIFVTYEGQVKILDFGIAKASGRASETRQGIVKGKVRYMSPEQATGERIDRRSDFFAMGLLLWEAATGQRFWRDFDDVGILANLLGGTYDPSPKTVNPDVPDAIDAICRRALSFSPEARYSTASQFRADLEDAVGDKILVARRALGERVSTLFAKECKQLRGIIEQASRESPSVVSMPLLESAASRSSDSNSIDSIDSLAPVSSRSFGSFHPPTSPSDFTAPLRRSSRPPGRSSRSSRPPATEIVPTLAQERARPLTGPPPPRSLADEPNATEFSILGFLPRRKRFGAGIVFGAATMLCCMIVAFLAVSGVVSSRQGAAGADRANLRIAEATAKRSLVTATVTAKSLERRAEIAPPTALPATFAWRPATAGRPHTTPASASASASSDTAPSSSTSAPPLPPPTTPHRPLPARTARPLDTDIWKGE